MSATLKPKKKKIINKTEIRERPTKNRVYQEWGSQVKLGLPMQREGKRHWHEGRRKDTGAKGGKVSLELREGEGLKLGRQRVGAQKAKGRSSEGERSELRRQRDDWWLLLSSNRWRWVFFWFGKTLEEIAWVFFFFFGLKW